MIEETLVLFQNIRNPSYDKSLKGYNFFPKITIAKVFHKYFTVLNDQFN